MATFIPNVSDVFPEPALFTPDFSFMDKMLQRRQSMYDQGWAQVNGAYNYVNKELTNPQNVKDRDIFLKQAKNNLKNLAGVDLSQHQNVMSATNVFQTWVNNTKALGDASLTSHWKQQESIGDGYRLEDGGKYFNQANVDYIRKQRMAFAGDTPESWEDYWKNKRSYSPYYDYHKEVQDLMKDFKPSTYKIDRINGLYKFTDENASWTKAEIRKYLDANLSDKAKQQMRIEGDVAYNNDPKQLGQMFISMAKDEIEGYDAGIELANKQLKSISNPDEIKKVKEYITNLEDAKKSINSTIDAINKGDYSYIKKKGEALSMNIYYNQFMNKISKGWSHDDITHKIDADQVSLAIYKENREDIRQQRGFQHSEKLAMMKGEIAPPAQYNEITIPESKEKVSLSTFQNKADAIDAQTNQLVNVNKGMVATWMATLPENKGKEISTNQVDDKATARFLREGMNGKPIPLTHAFYKNHFQIQENEVKKSVALNRIKDVEEKVKQSYSPQERARIDALNQKIEKIGDIKLDDGTVISSKKLFDGVKNGTIQISSNTPFGINFDKFGGNDYVVKINGKEHRAVNKIQGRGPGSGVHLFNVQNNDLLSAVLQIRNVQSDDVFKKHRKDVENYFGKNAKEMTYTANLQTFGKGSYEAKTLESEMYNMFPEEKYNIQHAGIGADARNQGSAFFYITGKGDFEPSSQNVVAYLNQRGYKDVQAIESQGTGATLYKINNFQSPIISQYNQFAPIEREIIQDLSLERYSGTGGRYLTSQYTSRSNRPLQIKKEHNSYYLLVKDLYGTGTSIMEQYPQTFADPSSAILTGQYLTSSSPQGVQEAQLKAFQELQRK